MAIHSPYIASAVIARQALLVVLGVGRAAPGRSQAPHPLHLQKHLLFEVSGPGTSKINVFGVIDKGKFSLVVKYSIL